MWAQRVGKAPILEPAEPVFDSLALAIERSAVRIVTLQLGFCRDARRDAAFGGALRNQSAAFAAEPQKQRVGKPTRCLTRAHARQHRSVSGYSRMNDGGHVPISVRQFHYGRQGFNRNVAQYL